MTIALAVTIALNLFLIWMCGHLLEDCVLCEKELENEKKKLEAMQKVEQVRAKLDSAEPAVIDELYSKFDRNP